MDDIAQLSVQLLVTEQKVETGWFVPHAADTLKRRRARPARATVRAAAALQRFTSASDRRAIMDLQQIKPDRLHIDPNDKAAVNHLMRSLGKSREEVLAAIEKVGTNIETVRKELARMDGEGAPQRGG